jgi:hypothetical protein
MLWGGATHQAGEAADQLGIHRLAKGRRVRLKTVVTECKCPHVSRRRLRADALEEEKLCHDLHEAGSRSQAWHFQCCKDK